MTVQVSIVVPCFNEADVIDRLVESLSAVLNRIDRDFEVILVDDGSSDSTVERMKAIHKAFPRFRYLVLSRNFGKEGAMLAGLSAAQGRAVAIMDADLQHPPELLPEMIALIDAGFEQVVARRDRTGDPHIRSAVSKLYYRFVNGLIDVELEDGAGDFRVLNRAALDALLSLPESNRFSKGLFAWIGFRTAYVDYRNVSRAGGQSKWSTTALINYGVDSVISFNNKPLRLAIYLGVLISTIAVAYGLWVVVEAFAYGNPVPGYVTLVCAVVGFGGLQMILLGVIGEYLGRIYIETKSRPHFLVRESDSTPQTPSAISAQEHGLPSSETQAGNLPLRPSA